MPDRARNNRVMRRPRTLDRSMREQQPTQMGVFERQPFVAGVQNTSVPQFLGRLAEMRHEYVIGQVQDAAIESAVTGEPSEEFENNRLFQDTINQIQGATQATAMLAEAEADLERAVAEAVEAGEDFDAEAFLQQRVNQLLEEQEGPVHPEFQNTLFGSVLQAAPQFQQAASVAEANLQLEASEDAMREFIGTRFQTGAPVSEDTIKAIHERGDDLGFTRNEINGQIQEMLLGQMAVTEDKEVLESLNSSFREFLGKTDKGFLGRAQADIDRVYRSAKNRIETGENEQTEAEIRAANDTIIDLRSRIRRPTGDRPLPTFNDLAAVRDQIGEQAYMQLSEELDRAHHEQLEQAQADAEKAQLDTVIDNLMDRPAAFHTFDSDTRSAITDRIDERFQMSQAQFIAAAIQESEAEEPEAQQQAEANMWAAIDALDPYMSLVQDINHKPPGLASFIENSRPDSPHFTQAAKAWGRLQAVHGSDPIPSISESSVADLDQFNQLKTYGYTDEEALNYINTRHEISLSDARQGLKRDGRDEIEDAVANMAEISSRRFFMGEDITAANRLAMENTLVDMAAHKFRMNNDVEEAVEWAERRFMETHEPIGDRWVPIGDGISKGFGVILEDMRPTLVDDLKSHGVELPESGDFDFVREPMGDGSSRLWLVDPENPFVPLRDDKGDAIYLRPERITKAYSSIQKEEHRVSQQEAVESARRRRDQVIATMQGKGPAGMGRNASNAHDPSSIRSGLGQLLEQTQNTLAEWAQERGDRKDSEERSSDSDHAIRAGRSRAVRDSILRADQSIVSGLQALDERMNQE